MSNLRKTFATRKVRLTNHDIERKGEIPAREEFMLQLAQSYESLKAQAAQCGQEIILFLASMSAEIEVEQREVTEEEWNKEGRRRFGHDTMDWRFVCPNCGTKAAAREWKEVGAPSGSVGYTCVNHFKDEPTCDYTGGGPGAKNPVLITFQDGSRVSMFEFA